MTYTFEDFKREHSEEIVEKFKRAWDAEPDHSTTIELHKENDLRRFCLRAFRWSETSGGLDFWSDVSKGKHRKSVNDKEKNMLKQKWQQLTMALGVWLIGGRKIPVHPEAAFRDWRESDFTIKLQAELNDVIKEREEARKSSDEAFKERDSWRIIAHKVSENLCTANSERDKLARKFSTLKRKYNALIVGAASKKPKAKRAKK